MTSHEPEPTDVDEPSEHTEPTRPTEPVTRVDGPDPLRGSRTAGLWGWVVLLVVVLVLLAVFVLQNTQKVQVDFLGWTAHPPLAAALLIALAGGLAVAAIAGTLRILQLRRRVKRDRKLHAG